MTRRLDRSLRRVAELWLGLLVAIAAASCSLFSINADKAPLVETFDDGSSSFSAKLLRHQAISIAEGAGVDGSNAIRVAYEGSLQGSERVIVSHSLPKGSLEATVAYDVRFCNAFQFVKGGKLHGLGPANPVAGGLPVGDAQWSARVVFLANGRIGTYLYHQDLTGRYGEVITAANFQFEPDQYYSIALYVRLNDPPEAKNGRAQIFINGTKVVSHENVRFRAVGGEKTLINKLLFNTFHGGHTADYAPRSSDGSFSRECAYFDNLAIYPYFEVKEMPID